MKDTCPMLKIAATLLIGFGSILSLSPPLSAQVSGAPKPVSVNQPIDIAAARASMTGKWEGSLEYLDYSANKWFGIPVKTQVEDQGDGATMIRKSDFDDGPKVGTVRITSVELFDTAAATVTSGTFRKGRAVDVSTYKVRLEGAPTKLNQWVLVEEVLGKDDNRPAFLRLTTTRDGDTMETIKQIDFQDDDKSEWITRNRTRLKRVAQ
jgi:hypothetical protein